MGKKAAPFLIEEDQSHFVVINFSLLELEWMVVEPVEAASSPKYRDYGTIVPAESSEAVASKLTASGGSPEEGLATRLALGTRFAGSPGV